MSTQQPKPKQARPLNDSLIEQLRDLGRGFGTTVKDDLVGGVANDALASLFGAPKTGNLKPGQEVNLNQSQPKAPAEGAHQLPQRPERFPFPFRRREQFKPQYSPETVALLRQQEAHVAQKIEEIRAELKHLIAEIKTVNQEIQQAVDGQLVDPDTYHLNYLDRIKIMLKNMLKQLGESRTWLTTQKSRKKQMGYWNQYKKKGTSFGLNHERTVATQVG